MAEVIDGHQVLQTFDASLSLDLPTDGPPPVWKCGANQWGDAMWKHEKMAAGTAGVLSHCHPILLSCCSVIVVGPAVGAAIVVGTRSCCILLQNSVKLVVQQHCISMGLPTYGKGTDCLLSTAMRQESFAPVTSTQGGAFIAQKQAHEMYTKF